MDRLDIIEFLRYNLSISLESTERYRSDGSVYLDVEASLHLDGAGRISSDRIEIEVENRE